jgi:undecaprenyl-diphosphatase|tara:strand:+ start:8748 stop:9545 length:798 start_codon:yes stop_codon:yes gene_type:complete
MDLPTALLLGMVQGLTEWLPVSSSGHLVIFEHLSGVRPPLFFNIALHLGTLFAAGWLLREDILRALRATPRALRTFRDGTADPDERTVLLVLLASIPTAIIGYSFDTLATGWLGSLRITGAGLLVTASVLWLSRGRGGTHDTATVPFTVGAWMGLAQGLAVLPGLSRSGLTIAAGMAAGMRPVAAARLSFLMSMPAIIGATGLELLQDREGALAGVAPAEFLFGVAAAAVTGFLALRWLLTLVEQRRFHWFAPYCGVVGLALLVL